MIELKNVCYAYGNEIALRYINLNIQKGESVIIQGPNGCGKSTLLKLILNILQPTEGEIHLLGETPDKFKSYDKIAYVSQKATSFNRDFPATVEEIVTLGLYSQKGLFKKYGKEDKEKVASALKRVGMYDYKNRKIGHLSGGQQQRVAIARAIATEPPLILADEPTGNLDAGSSDEIMRILSELHNSGKTVVIITHDNSIAAMADKRIEISDGRII